MMVMPIGLHAESEELLSDRPRVAPSEQVNKVVSATARPKSIALPEPWGVRYRGAPIDKVSFSRRAGMVALTFDDGPDRAGVTREIAYQLARKGVHSTFFLLGGRVLGNPGDAHYVARNGHEVASHGYEHLPDVGRESGAGNYSSVDQVRLADEAIEKVTGRRPLWYRSPQGKFDWNASTAFFSSYHLYANWSMGNLDTVPSVTAQQSVDHVVSLAQDGDIIVCHSTNPINIWAIPRIVDGLRAKGLEPVTLSYLAGSGYPVGGVSR